MARKKTTESKRAIDTYEHKDKQRVNNPPVGLVTQETDPELGVQKTYAYDPHLDPQLDWAAHRLKKQTRRHAYPQPDCGFPPQSTSGE
ncbi:MAG: hypothetical protein U1B80_10205 [Anaerolineaceae bacterium]|nr:hypothetical protein [Anaerolineaceae bacterium]